jgi:hypothetical protein
MYDRAQAGKEKTLGSNATSILDTLNTVGSLYSDLGKPNAAEQM